MRGKPSSNSNLAGETCETWNCTHLPTWLWSWLSIWPTPLRGWCVAYSIMNQRSCLTRTLNLWVLTATYRELLNSASHNVRKTRNKEQRGSIMMEHHTPKIGEGSPRALETLCMWFSATPKWRKVLNSLKNSAPQQVTLWYNSKLNKISENAQELRFSVDTALCEQQLAFEMHHGHLLLRFFLFALLQLAPIVLQVRPPQHAGMLWCSSTGRISEKPSGRLPLLNVFREPI